MDRSNNRIQVFDESGEYLAQWAIPGPNKAVIDEKDVMHSASGSGGKVHLTTLDGDHIGSWGESGDEPW